ncbi:MAG: formimidoylglutamase [Cellvibrionaceae bacterium]|nr:formimidoylglutamase [Cellvibrionaceae bacterium]
MGSDKSFQWRGRIDDEAAAGSYRWHQKVGYGYRQPGIGMLGLACDLGVIANQGRPGAAAGPNSIRAALANAAWHLNTSVQDFGNITAADTLADTQQRYAAMLGQALQQHVFTLGLGGGHEIAWGSYLGLAENLGPAGRKIGIVNFDAHFDLRKPAPETSSGTPFYQIAEHANQHNGFYYACLGLAETSNTQALFERAQQLKVNYLSDVACDFAAVKTLLIPFLETIDELYVSICLDVFPASVAPGVSAPAALGITPRLVIETLHWLGQSQAGLNYCWRLLDIAEMNPRYDIDNQTARLAARLVCEACNAALKHDTM